MIVGALALAIAVGVAVGVLLFDRGKTRHVVEHRTDTVVVTVGRPAVPERRVPLPSMISGAFQPHDVALQEAVPADARVLDARYIRPSKGFRPEIVVTWMRDWTTSPFPEYGLIVWERVRGIVANWRRSYAWEAQTSKSTDVEGVKVSLGDFTGDGHADILLKEDLDGSAGNAYYRAIGLFPSMGTELWSRPLSDDQGRVELADGAIKVTEGFALAKNSTIHCCYRKVRIRWLRWAGERMTVVRTLERKNLRRWPPG